MAHVISLVSSKGGTGKTTTALNLAVALAERGRRTVLVGFDPQGSIGLSLAKGEREWTGLAEVLLAGMPLDSVLVQTKMPALPILPRGRLDAVDVREYEILLNSPARVAELVAQLAADRQYVIIDCPSGLGIITRAALASSGFALVPLQAEPLALRSIGQVLRVIEHVRQQENPSLRLLGLLPTMVELCRALAGFAVDPQGFVVATRGNVPANQFAGLGAEIAYAMEQLDRIDVESGSFLTLELQFESRRLLAVRVARNGGGSLVVGFVGARPLADEVRAAIMRQLTHRVDRLC